MGLFGFRRSATRDALARRRGGTFRPEVDEAFDGLYPGLEPVRLAVPRGTGLTGVAAYPVMGSEGNFWHFVGHGLSEPGADGDGEGQDPGADGAGRVSGYGLEWTVLVEGDVLGAPPEWPATLVQSLSTHVTAGASVEPGEHLRFVAPFTADERAVALSSVLLRIDPNFTVVDGIGGRFAFVQAVTIDDATCDRLEGDGVAAVLEGLVAVGRLCLTPE